MKKRKFIAVSVVAAVLLCGCGKRRELTVMQDGTYTAQMTEYSHGWKEYVTITVNNGEIVTTEYNAENLSGFIKSWDNAYMYNMKPVADRKSVV